MYGRKKYRSLDKIVSPPIVDNSIPSFICPRCHQLKTINNSYIDLTAIENSKVFLYTKMCSSCAELLKTWIKG